MSRRPVLTAADVRELRAIARVPHWKRWGKPSLRTFADLRGVSYSAVVRAARHEQRCYESVAPNEIQEGSRGVISPGKGMTERGVRRPVALSVAGSTVTTAITGGACGAEPDYHERKAESRGVTGNAGAAGRSLVVAS